MKFFKWLTVLCVVVWTGAFTAWAWTGDARWASTGGVWVATMFVFGVLWVFTVDDLPRFKDYGPP